MHDYHKALLALDHAACVAARAAFAAGVSVEQRQSIQKMAFQAAALARTAAPGVEVEA